MAFWCMKLSANQSYQHREIKSLLTNCPICGSSDEMTLWATMKDILVGDCREGIGCKRCALELVFSYHMNHDCEIVDAYILDYFKIGNIEFKNNASQLALYANNTYVRDIDSNIVDLAKCKSLVLFS
jgi:hypothetical protein